MLKDENAAGRENLGGGQESAACPANKQNMDGESLLVFPAKPQARTNGTIQSAICLFKAVVGSGVYAYPPAVREAGWVLATAVATLFLVVNVYSMAVLNLAIVMMRKQGLASENDGRIEYHHLTAHIFSRPVNAVFVALAVLGQLMSLSAMIIFVADQISPLLPGSVPNWQIAAVVVAVVTPLSLLRTTDSIFFQLAMQACAST